MRARDLIGRLSLRSARLPLSPFFYCVPACTFEGRDRGWREIRTGVAGTVRVVRSGCETTGEGWEIGGETEARDTECGPFEDV